MRTDTKDKAMRESARPFGESNINEISLSKDDQEALDELEGRMSVVTDRVRSVIADMRHAFFLYGPGGNGKTYLVRTALKRFGADFLAFNSRMTGRALFDVLRDSPKAIHLLEDMETLMADRHALGVLRSAAGGEDGQERLVTWVTHTDGVIQFEFTGKLIIVSNRSLGAMPELQAVSTRFSPVEWKPTDIQLAALMRSVALGGYEHHGETMNANECMAATELIIQTSQELGRHLDMRLFFHACSDYVQWRTGQTDSHWRDLIISAVREQPSAAHFQEGREERKRREQDLIRELVGQSSDRKKQIEMWCGKTGKSNKTFYRQLKEIGGDDACRK